MSLLCRLCPASLTAIFLSVSCSAATLIFSTTQTFSSHSADIYDPTSAFEVRVLVPFSNSDAIEGQVGTVLLGLPASIDHFFTPSIPNSLIPALNDPTTTRLQLLADRAIHEIPKPIFPGPIAFNNFVPKRLSVNHPSGGGTDVTSTITFNFYGVPEPSSVAEFVIGCVACLAIAPRRSSAPCRR